MLDSIKKWYNRTWSNWEKIGDVKKYKPYSCFKSSHQQYSVLIRKSNDGLEQYKEIYVASDTYTHPKF